jgi:hypothetical protein
VAGRSRGTEMMAVLAPSADQRFSAATGDVHQ